MRLNDSMNLVVVNHSKLACMHLRCVWRGMAVYFQDILWNAFHLHVMAANN